MEGIRMDNYEKSVIPMIESVYDSFTTVEKNIADFFLHNTENMDFCAKSIANHLFVSEASLSRFAKKCGFAGYREFLFRYQESFLKEEIKMDSMTKSVLNTYQELLNKSYSLVDEAQLIRITNLLLDKNRVYVYGKGSSGLVAKEMKLRFMRIGLDVEAMDDTHVMKMNSVVLHSKCLVIGISISGITSEVISSLKEAKKSGAAVILITSKLRKEFEEFCDEVLLISVKKHLEYGNVISPQFPILVMLDILYAYFLQADRNQKEALHDYTLNALNQ